MALFRQPHFWIALIAVSIGAVQACGVIPPGKWMQLSVAAQTIIGWVAYQTGVTWTPPRRPWNDEQRAAHGLPPEKKE
jgi:hypothetical protein